MKKKYETIEVEFVKIKLADVILTSENDDEDLVGEGGKEEE